MPISSYDILDYQIFHEKIIELTEYYKSTGYDIVLIAFGMNRSQAEWKFYARIYMNDSEKPTSEVGTIIPTLWNITEDEDLLVYKAENYG